MNSSRSEILWWHENLLCSPLFKTRFTFFNKINLIVFVTHRLYHFYCTSTFHCIRKCLHDKSTIFHCGLRSHTCLHDHHEIQTSVKLWWHEKFISCERTHCFFRDRHEISCNHEFSSLWHQSLHTHINTA